MTTVIKIIISIQVTKPLYQLELKNTVIDTIITVVYSKLMTKSH